MSLLDAMLLESSAFDCWLATRSDGIKGSGTASDPYDASTKREILAAVSAMELTADPSGREGEVTLSFLSKSLTDGDIITVSGVTGAQTGPWNGSFGVYNVSHTGSQTKFRYYMKPTPLNPSGPFTGVTILRSSFLFDDIMRAAPARIRIHIGPGVFQTRGFAAGDVRGWQPKSGQKIVGAGFDVTTLQLVGADQGDAHYHAVGMPIEAEGATPIEPLQSFEISDLTIDCNVDAQPVRFDQHPTIPYGNVACGAVRILGNECRIHNVKAINWGTKSLNQGCFVFSIIQASAQPSHAFGYPLLTETAYNRIEDCIAIEPSPNCARETTVLHIGGVKNASNHAQGFGLAAHIARNFVDCSFKSTPTANQLSRPYPSAFLTGTNSTRIIAGSPLRGEFVGKRPHSWNDGDIGKYVRFYNPHDASSRWNGYFPIQRIEPTFRVELSSSVGTTDNSSFVVMGTEFRGISVSSCITAVVEQNQIHNCWIGGPYQSPMDVEAAYDPEVPPTLAREERLDPLNALHIRSLIVRDNFYRSVAVGPYFKRRAASMICPRK